MTLFPERDDALYAQPAHEGWATDEALHQLLAASGGVPQPGERRVVVRLPDGDELVVASTADRDEAIAIARETVEAIEKAEAENAWLEIQDRFVRPSAVVAVDVDIVE